jgi:hypothetical protein
MKGIYLNMPDGELLYEQMIDQNEKIKYDFLKKCVDSKLAFVTLDRGIIFHVLKSFHPLRVVAFREDEFSKFINDGTVIAFKKNHEGCLAMHEGEDKILEFMKLNLPFEKYSQFEKWMFNRV